MEEDDYRALAEFRYQLRRFLRFSEESARSAGLAPQQHQLLLAIKSMPANEAATVNALAERMQLRQNSVVELIDRCVSRGLVGRAHCRDDRREVVVMLTAPAMEMLGNISQQNRQELNKRGPLLLKSLKRVLASQGAKSKSPSNREERRRV